MQPCAWNYQAWVTTVTLTQPMRMRMLDRTVTSRAIYKIAWYLSAKHKGKIFSTKCLNILVPKHCCLGGLVPDRKAIRALIGTGAKRTETGFGA